MSFSKDQTLFGYKKRSFHSPLIWIPLSKYVGMFSSPEKKTKQKLVSNFYLLHVICLKYKSLIILGKKRRLQPSGTSIKS
jgi:hypothetical protein